MNKKIHLLIKKLQINKKKILEIITWKQSSFFKEINVVYKRF